MQIVSVGTWAAYTAPNDIFFWLDYYGADGAIVKSVIADGFAIFWVTGIIRRKLLGMVPHYALYDF